MPSMVTVFFIVGSSSLSAICSAAVPAALGTGLVFGFHSRRRRALDTTHTLLRDMQAAAIIGFSSKPSAGYSTPAATGMPTLL